MSRKHDAGGSTPAIHALIEAGVAHGVHEYEHDPASDLSYGMEAAVALGVEPEQVFKTLCSEVDGRLCVGIVPVGGMLDLKALAKAFGAKRAEMAEPRAAERATGYVVGGISPLGQRNAHPTAIDETVELFDEVYVSGGRRGLDISLAPADLIRLTGAVVAPIAKES
ncbi:Cys-tRNA(Pro) deacylase [Demequina capsici]|uniref:Cys-tRNA(Pro)/Cys-tRNA(Cys) deacylase n=1 Tax=Demequina capsici TaxID=3075620 RepID=A0AA96FDC9_9MICO|nr:Cys-tRNA(Pro) deacylase [Demequina sp. PMTSA13]WNM28224.1 Cys-tRNA(Pro) deacylase [Demequina sp. PMTSA13]